MSLRRWSCLTLFLAALGVASPAVLAQQVIKLSTTTSTENSGLLSLSAADVRSQDQ